MFAPTPRDWSKSMFRGSRSGQQRWLVPILIVTTTLFAAPFAIGGIGRGGFIRQPGGIVVDAEGVVRMPTTESRTAYLKSLRELVKAPAADLNAPVPLRRISLRALEAALQETLTSGMPLPDEMRFLAGLQRIEYVFVYPEQQDIVLAGPAEGWRVDENANIVGVTTGRPVMRLDDLLVALRTAQSAQQTGIACSIEPTAEGRQRLQQVLDRQRASRAPLNPRALEPAMQEAFGPQQVLLSGVPADSHFARVLVSADFQMKRLGMHLDPSPVRGLPSYVDLIKNGGAFAENPRWWLACNYEPLARSEDGLAWQIRGPGVKALSEDNLVQADGTVRGAGKASGPAQRWADLLTEKYDELSVRNPVFGEVRNLMDLCVVAAIIEIHDLRGVAGCQLPLLCENHGALEVEQWQTPKTIDPHCSFLRSKNEWIVTASGGVQIESWEVADHAQISAELAGRRTSLPKDHAWWWN